MRASKNNINMTRYVQKYKIQNEAKAKITIYTYNIQYTIYKTLKSISQEFHQ